MDDTNLVYSYEVGMVADATCPPWPDDDDSIPY